MKILAIIFFIIITFFIGNKYIHQDEVIIDKEIEIKENIPKSIKEKLVQQQKEDEINLKENSELIKVIEKDIKNVENEIILKKEESEEIWDIKNYNISIIKNNYSSNIDNTIKFYWNNLEEIIQIEIWNFNYKPQYLDWNLYLVINKNEELNWEYDLVFKTKSWYEFNYENKINFNFIEWNVIVTDITPKNISNDNETNIVLQWKWFSKIISIQLSNNIVFKNTSFNIINDNVMSVLIPKDINEWKYTLNLMDISWINKSNISIEIYNK